MASPAYTTDLITFNLAENSGTVEELTGTATAYNTGGTPVNNDTDDIIQGSYHASASAGQKSGLLGSIAFDYGSGVTVPTDGAFVIWHKIDCGGILDNYTNGGVRICVGSSLTAFKVWRIAGNDVPPFPYGGWKNYAIDPTLTADWTEGSPSATLQHVGMAVMFTVQGPGKGSPHKLDAVRYGRCDARFSGGESANYATIAGFAAVNDASTAKWGLIQAVAGGYLWKGLISLGESNQATATRARNSNVATITFSSAHKFKVGDVITVAGLGGSNYNGTWTVATVPASTSLTYANSGTNESQTADTGGTVGCIVDFRDSNRVVFIDDTRKVGANFNRVEIKHGSSRVDLTGYSFICTAPSSTASKGRFEVVDDCDVNLDTCLFQDMDTLIFKATSTILSTIFRRCALITQNGAVFDGCTFDKPSGAVGLYSDDLNDIDNCEFISDGTGHAIELSTAHAGTSKTLVNVGFTGYGADGTDNAAIYNNSGGAVTITIDGGDTPTIKNGSGASTTIVSGAVDLKVTVKTAAGANIESARVLLKASDALGPFPFEETVTIVNSGTTATVTHTGHGMLTNDKVMIEGASLQANNGVFTITKINDDSYSYTMSSSPGSSPTGTIKATFVALSGLTDSNGEISTSRVYSADQNVNGWARKASASPYYKPGVLSGYVDSVDGFTATAILILDQA